MLYKKQVENTSSWETDSLIEIVKKCAEFRGVDLRDRLKKKQVRSRRRNWNTWSPLRIQHTKSSWRGVYTGRCYSRNGDPNPRRKGNIYLGVPKPENLSNGFNKERFAQVVLHEIDHLLGLKHSEMPDSSELDTPDLDGVQVAEK